MADQGRYIGLLHAEHFSSTASVCEFALRPALWVCLTRDEGTDTMASLGLLGAGHNGRRIHASVLPKALPPQHLKIPVAPLLATPGPRPCA